MSVEAELIIEFTYRKDDKIAWKTFPSLLDEGYRGAKLQDALDSVSESAADALEEVWAQLPCGGDGFDLGRYSLKGDRCRFSLLTINSVATMLEELLTEWFKLCPVSEVSFEYLY